MSCNIKEYTTAKYLLKHYQCKLCSYIGKNIKDLKDHKWNNHAY